MNKSSKAFVGMDVHKESIDWAVAELDGEVRPFGRTGGDLNAVARTVRKLVARGKTMNRMAVFLPFGSESRFSRASRRSFSISASVRERFVPSDSWPTRRWMRLLSTMISMR